MVVHSSSGQCFLGLEVYFQFSVVDSWEMYVLLLCRLSTAGLVITDHTHSWLREDRPLVCHGPSISLSALTLPDLDSSAVIEDVAVLCDAGVASMAYFYFDFADSDKQHLRSLLASLLIQLSSQSQPFFDILSHHYPRHSGSSQMASVYELAECLKEMLTIPNQCPVYIILDALNECPNSKSFGIPSPQEQVLTFLKELVDLGPPSLHVCITSHLESDIQASLEQLEPHHVSLHDESGQKLEIVDYIKSIVYS
jgi:hypothetical protein